MKLEFQEVWFRNFLSYGDSWNHIDFHSGVNFIVGKNGIGKSSALMAVSFALFGKVQKDIVKADIVNWQNKKKCEVEVSFYKKDEKYTIRRGMKPNYLEIEIDGVVQPKDSDVRVTQRRIVNDILGFNFDIFNNLIFCNMNNTISILDTTAHKKRKFIENLFSDMEYFSEMMDKTTEKIKSIKEKINEKNIKIRFLNDNIASLNEEIEELEIPDINKEFREYRDLTDRYNELVEGTDDVESELEYLKSKKSDVEKRIFDHETEQRDLKDKIADITWKHKALEKELEDSKAAEQYKAEIKEAEEYIEENKNIINDIEESKKRLENHKKNLNSLKDELSKLQSKRDTLEEQKKSLYPDYNLKNKINCPTCGENIDYEKTKEHFKAERKKIDDQIKEIDGRVKDIKYDLEQVKSQRDEEKTHRESLDEIKQELKSRMDKKKYLQTFISNTRQVSEIQGEIDEIEHKKESFNEEHRLQNDKINVLLLERDGYDLDIQNLQKNVNDIKETKDQLEIKKLSYEHKKSTKADVEKRLRTKKSKIEKAEKEQKTLNQSIRKLNDLRDYFEFIKESLKDENIKSYIINIMIPYLNQKVNEYLVNLGFDFYVEFDSWLNVSIHGPNSRNSCSLASMSGGEAKSIDLITKFALMNIAKIKAKYYPDLLVLDEILDSSIDAEHLEQLMEIVKHEQEKDNLKVYVISHRPEINDMSGSGKVYKVSKKNNFSYYEEM